MARIEKIIDVELKTSDGPMGIVKFSHNGRIVGTVDVRIADETAFDIAFLKFAQSEWNWQTNDRQLVEMLYVYRHEAETCVDYADKTYRFIPSNATNPSQSPWKLTTDKSDIRVGKTS